MRLLALGAVVVGLIAQDDDAKFGFGRQPTEAELKADKRRGRTVTGANVGEPRKGFSDRVRRLSRANRNSQR